MLLSSTAIYVYVALFTAAVAGLTMWAYWMRLKSKSKSKFRAGKHDSRCVYYYSPTCHHCSEFNPVWDEAVKRMEGAGVEMAKEVPAPSSGIKFVPTITRTTDDGRVVEMRSDRSVDSVVRFCSAHEK